ncbi:MAG: phycobilisome protein [Oscillatoria princeps RMCB-10]|jgi:hypothetical protein|nr:phycobilisome protein [Oscillatoria princeps RMCB-10]
MRSINSLLEDLANQSEGRYLTPAELQPVYRYLKTFSNRLQTYGLLRERSDKLIQESLKKFLSLQPEVMRKHGSRCQYDMTAALRYMALSVLRDDPAFFKENLLYWQANILAAYRQHEACLVAYRCLQETLNEQLPAAANQLLEPYIDMILQTLDLPPKLMAPVQKVGAKY